MTIDQAVQQGIDHYTAGRLQEAELLLRQVLQVCPDHPDALHALGLIAERMGHYEAAVQLIGRAITVHPTPANYNSLGEVYRAMGVGDHAVACYQRSLQLDPDFSIAYSNMGIVLAILGRTSDAIAAWRRTIQLTPDAAIPHNNLGNALQSLGRINEAIAHHRRALQLNPRLVESHSNLLRDLSYHPRLDADTVAAEHAAWWRSHGAPHLRPIAPHTNDRSPDRRLRIGYVSADFRQHAVSYFIEPILERHDRGRFEVFCYTTSGFVDHVTQRIQQRADGWRSIVGHTEEQAAQLIRQDRIDILVDLLGHTAGNRILLFAYKPAPVQVTYLGYTNTTGVPTMDYWLTDAHLDPPGAREPWCIEKRIRLPRTFACYRPPVEAPPVQPPPSQVNGYITFGCFNTLAKLNDDVLDLWSAVLKSASGSRLLLKDRFLGDEPIRETLRQRFAARGVAPGRLVLEGHSAVDEYLRTHHRVDILLDVFPFTGHTTSLHALWMGVPMVTLAGNTHVSRRGVSVLENLGLPELIADSPAKYVELATALATDAPRLRKLRAEMRQRMLNSPVCDEARFVQTLEDTFRQMWQAWCSGSTP